MTSLDRLPVETQNQLDRRGQLDRQLSLEVREEIAKHLLVSGIQGARNLTYMAAVISYRLDVGRFPSLPPNLRGDELRTVEERALAIVAELSKVYTTR